MKRDFESNMDVAPAFVPATVTATGTGVAVDLKGYDSAVVEVHIGTVATGGTITPSLTESADGTTYTAVGTGDLQGAFAAVAAGTVGLQKVGYIGTGRYVKPVLTFAGTGAGAIVQSAVVRANPARSPL